MPDIRINDAITATADLKIKDDAPLAKAGLANLNFSAFPLVGDLDKRVDQCSFKSAAFGVKINSPGEIAIQTALTGALGLINRPQETLFEAMRSPRGYRSRPARPGFSSNSTHPLRENSAYRQTASELASKISQKSVLARTRC